MAPAEAPVLELVEVTKRFRGPRGEIVAVGGVSLAVGQGELVALEGPSGSGKTTLLLAAGALLRPDSGRVLHGGRDVYALAVEERAALRASRVGFVFQQFHLIPYLSVVENVLVPSLARRGGDASARAAAILERTGLRERADHRPDALSTGERQRAAVARALLNDPPLVLADEPTGNLDSASATKVLDLLVEFARNGGAVLLVTHDPRAADRSTRRLRIEAGRIADGTQDRRRAGDER